MSLDDIVNVQISKQTATVSRVGFGVPLILTYHTKDAARVLEFSSASDMLAAAGGPFASTDMAYKMAVAAFSQDPRPAKVLVGRRVFPTIRTVRVTPRSGVISGETYPLPNTAYSITIGAETFTFTTDATPTVAEVTAGLVALINAGSEDVLATDNTTDFTVEAADSPGGTATAGVPFTVSTSRALMAMKDETPVAAGGTLADEIAAIQTFNDDWYGLVGDWFGETEIAAVAAAIETLPKIHTATSADDEMYDSGVTTDIGSDLQSAAYARSWVSYHPTPDITTGMIAAAEMGKNLPKDPGSITWKFKTLAGVTPVTLTAGEKTALENKNVGRYTRVSGVNITCDGKTASGEFVDVTRFIDFLKARMQERVFTKLANLDKVPFTNDGIAVVEAEVLGTLALGISVGGLAADPAPTVTVPNAIVGTPNGVDATDKANRVLDGVEFCATLAGAIHEVQIEGKVVI